MKIGIIGYGWVGKGQHKLFPDAVIYDKHNPYIPEEETLPTTMDDINKCDIAFVCVPTPLKKNPSRRGRAATEGLDCSIVEEAVQNCKCPLIVIRSTVMPGTTDRLAKKYKKHLVFQPEYLGETVGHPLFDPKGHQFLVLGGAPEDRHKVIEAYQLAYNANVRIRQVTAYEAEIVKMSANRAVAFKVAQCQELYDACKAAKVDYYTIRDIVYGDDPRFNLWFSFIFPKSRGFNSKCIPKDIYGWAAWAESCGFEPKLTRAMLKVNEKYLKQNRTTR